MTDFKSVSISPDTRRYPILAKMGPADFYRKLWEFSPSQSFWSDLDFYSVYTHIPSL